VAEDGCILCAIDCGKPAVKKLYDDDLVYAIDMPEDSEFHRAPVHFMVVPHKHVPSALQMTTDEAELGGRLFTVAAQIAREKDIAESGFRLATNSGPDANQTVFHFHLHCLGGRKLGHEG
jgi:histidine triad (HIT) family protein